MARAESGVFGNALDGGMEYYLIVWKNLIRWIYNTPTK